MKKIIKIAVIFSVVVLLIISCGRKQDEVELLISDLDFTDKFIQMEAIEKLQKEGDPRAVEPIASCLSDPHEEVRITAIKALGSFNDPETIDDMIGCFNDESRAVQRNAIESLQGFGDKPVQPLIEATKDKNWQVRARAAETLGKIGSNKAVDPLLKLLNDQDGDVRLEAAIALGEIGDAKAVEPLEVLREKEVKLKNWSIVTKIQDALDQLGD